MTEKAFNFPGFPGAVGTLCSISSTGCRCQDGTRHLNKWTQPSLVRGQPSIWQLQGFKEEDRDVDDWHGTEERGPRIHLSLHKGLIRGYRSQTHRSSRSYRWHCSLESHCKPRSNEIVAATAYRQLVQGDLGLPQYIKEMQRNHGSIQLLGIAYNECLRNDILLGLRNQQVYKKCITVGDQLTSADEILSRFRSI